VSEASLSWFAATSAGESHAQLSRSSSPRHVDGRTRDLAILHGWSLPERPTDQSYGNRFRQKRSPQPEPEPLGGTTGSPPRELSAASSSPRRNHEIPQLRQSHLSGGLHGTPNGDSITASSIAASDRRAGHIKHGVGGLDAAVASIGEQLADWRKIGAAENAQFRERLKEVVTLSRQTLDNVKASGLRQLQGSMDEILQSIDDIAAVQKRPDDNGELLSIADRLTERTTSTLQEEIRSGLAVFDGHFDEHRHRWQKEDSRWEGLHGQLAKMLGRIDRFGESSAQVGCHSVFELTGSNVREEVRRGVTAAMEQASDRLVADFSVRLDGATKLLRDEAFACSASSQRADACKGVTSRRWQTEDSTPPESSGELARLRREVAELQGSAQEAARLRKEVVDLQRAANEGDKLRRQAAELQDSDAFRQSGLLELEEQRQEFRRASSESHHLRQTLELLQDQSRTSISASCEEAESWRAKAEKAQGEIHRSRSEADAATWEVRNLSSELTHLQEQLKWERVEKHGKHTFATEELERQQRQTDEAVGESVLLGDKVKTLREELESAKEFELEFGNKEADVMKWHEEAEQASSDLWQSRSENRELQDQLKRARANQEQLENLRGELIVAKAEARENSAAAEGALQLQELQEQLQQVAAHDKLSQEELAHSRRDLQSSEQKALDMEEQLESAHAKLGAAQDQREVEQLRVVLRASERKVRDLQEQLGRAQNSSEQKGELQDQLKRMVDQDEQSQQELDQVRSELAKAHGDAEGMSAQVKASQRTTKEVQEQLVRAQKVGEQANQMQSELDKSRTDEATALSAVEAMTGKLASLQKEMLSQKAELSTAQKRSGAKERSEVETLSVNLVSCKEEIQNLRAELSIEQTRSEEVGSNLLKAQADVEEARASQKKQETFDLQESEKARKIWSDRVDKVTKEL